MAFITNSFSKEELRIIKRALETEVETVKKLGYFSPHAEEGLLKKVNQMVGKSPFDINFN